MRFLRNIFLPQKKRFSGGILPGFFQDSLKFMELTLSETRHHRPVLAPLRWDEMEGGDALRRWRGIVGVQSQALGQCDEFLLVANDQVAVAQQLPVHNQYFISLEFKLLQPELLSSTRQIRSNNK